MKRYFVSYLGGVFLAGTAFALLPAAQAADETAKPAAAQPADPAQVLPNGVESKELGDTNAIYDAFADITNAPFHKNAFDQIFGRLVDADQKRIKEWQHDNLVGQKLKDLEARTVALDHRFHEKYGNDVRLDARVVFGTNGFVSLARGEIVDPARLVGHWPLAPVADNAARTASERLPGQPLPGAPADTQQQKRDINQFDGGDAKLNKGRTVAVATYPGSHQMPALTLSMLQMPFNSWRFDIPDNVGGAELYANLTRHLDMLNESTSHWPDSVEEGYRMVARHMLMALYDVSPSTESQQKQ